MTVLMIKMINYKHYNDYDKNVNNIIIMLIIWSKERVYIETVC